MRKPKLEAVSAARWLVGGIAAVTLAFVFATTVDQYLLSTIQSRTTVIVGNAMPSLQLLSLASVDLHRLENVLDRYLAGSPEQRSVLRGEVTARRQDLEAALSAYLALPYFPHERPLSERIQEATSELDAQLRAVLSESAGVDVVALQRQLDIVDDAIGRVAVFDAAQGERLGLEVQRIHGDRSIIVTWLDALSILLAMGAVFLALRQLRQVALAQTAEHEALERRKAELEAQNDALGQFSGRVAHDVLSPLSTAKLSMEVVKRASETNPDATRAIARGLAAVARVQTLVDGLLAFSRAGGRPEEGLSTEIEPVITEVVDELTPLATQGGIALTVSPVPRGSVACSSGVLTSLVTNLVRNAIKYMGDSAQRRIDIRVLEAGERWRVEVEDTGPGIPEEAQSRIFQPYVRLTRGGQGIGLGLATVYRLVHGHEGALGLVSPPEGGSLFWFELPKANGAR